MSRVNLKLMGGFEAQADPGGVLTIPTRKAQALLAYLALTPGQSHPRDKLAALLWPDVPPGAARADLRQTLFVLRKALGSDPLVVTGDAITLPADAVHTDATAFERAVAAGTPPALDEAAGLYRGDFLAGVSVEASPFEDWLMSERERLRELALEALAKLLAGQRTAGALEAAIHTALTLLGLDPLQEPVHRTLMRLYAEVGRRGAALRQYQACVAGLQRELGVDPEAETQQLYQEILRQRPALPAAALRAPSPPSREPAGPPAGAPAFETALIGRNRELVQLRQAVENAGRQAGTVIAVLGEAGIGKSRLLGELAAAALAHDAHVLLGRCHATEQILPLAPWAEALRQAGIPDDAEVAAGLGPVWRAELARLLPELAAAGSPMTTDPADPLRLFEAVTWLLAELGGRRLVVVLLEDLHWADEMTVRLLAFVGRRCQGRRVLIAVTVRADEPPATPMLQQAFDELKAEGRLLELSLAPLSESDTTVLVAALARTGLEAAAVARLGQQVWAASHGNPFMVVESMGTLREAGTAGPRLSDRAREVIAGRLGLLAPGPRALVDVAAVIGREFDFALLHRASGLAERDVAEAAEQLVRRRVLHEVGERFDLRHDQIREVAYDAILPPRRRLLHRQVAEAIEALYADDLAPHAAALARHYAEVERWDRAVSYLRETVAQAVTRGAFRQAAATLDQALATLARLPDRRDVRELAVDLRFDLRNALFSLGEPERIFACLREAVTLADGLDDSRRLARALAHLTPAFRLAGQYERAFEHGRRAFDLAVAVGDLGLQAVARLYLGHTYQSVGDYRSGRAALEQNVTVLAGPRVRERFGQPGFPAMTSRAVLARCLAELGEFSDAAIHAAEALRFADEVALPFVRMITWSFVILLYVRRGDLTSAAALAERGRVLGGREDLRAFWPWLAAGAGYAHALAGRLAEGRALLEDALAESDALGMVSMRAQTLGWLGEARLLAGAGDEARRHGEEALELAVALGERGNAAWAHRLLGEVASADRDAIKAEAAVAHFQAALTGATELGMRPLAAHARLGLGRLCRRLGHPEARGHLEAAVGELRALEMTLWLPDATAELADLGRGRRAGLAP
ncbi:MAG TPA: BTAD domain-containing putative transcriptional regulator [Methylomirabilota bacterium]|nr:BTAD domain-containing putative transcriptional regulator [Methylomirabilota bacterium]